MAQPHPWIVPPSAPRGVPALDLDAVALLLDAPLAGNPARAMLSFLNRLAPVEYLSLVEYADEGPTLREGHAHRPGVRNITGECWRLYRHRFFGYDEATRLAARLGEERGGRGGCGTSEAGAPLPSQPQEPPVLALHYRPQDIPVAGWRQEIYEREHLSDRLTFVYSPLPGTAYSINLYRDESLGGFGTPEIDRLMAAAPLLRQVHRNALRLRGQEASRTARVAAAAEALKEKAPQLSPREREVCARIAWGMSADGIAAELDIAPSTVVTLRKRAYQKLGIHSRLELARFVE